MNEKPTTAAGYSPIHTKRVHATCLEIASRLGDLGDQICIVGGLVPLLIVNQNSVEPGFETHVGTLDLDLGLALAVLDARRYQEISERLRRAEFKPDQTEAGRLTTQRWVSVNGVRVDFLIPPTSDRDKGGELKNLESDFAAIITPGLPLAFEDRTEVLISGATPSGARIDRKVWVCGPAAYVVLKALALGGRGENKDAYDLYYVVRYHSAQAPRIASRLRAFGPRPEVAEAIEILRRDFATAGHVGPARVAKFMTGTSDDDIQADACGLILDLLNALDAEQST